jgi:hypothetical protein
MSDGAREARQRRRDHAARSRERVEERGPARQAAQTAEEDERLAGAAFPDAREDPARE